MLTTTTRTANVSGAKDTELFLATETDRQAVIIRQEETMAHHDLDQDLGEMMTIKDGIPQAATTDIPLVVAPSARAPIAEMEMAGLTSRAA